MKDCACLKPQLEIVRNDGATILRWMQLCDRRDTKDGVWVALTTLGHDQLIMCHSARVHGNGMRTDWRGVLGYLARCAAAEACVGWQARSNRNDGGPELYNDIMLGQRSMRVSALAMMLGREPDEIRAELADLLVTGDA